MLKNAVDVKRQYLEKHYPDIIERIVSAINSAIDREHRSVEIELTSFDWRSFDYSEIEWYVKSFNYDCKLNESKVERFGDPRKHVYIIQIDWHLEE